MTVTKPIHVVAGPTASGKSSLALALARHIGGQIINADSMQVYRDLRILTARPDESAQLKIPHRLYGVLDGQDLCSAARWANMARAEIDRCFEQGAVPIICGGTGLYLAALLHGIAPIPNIPSAIRNEARAKHAEIGGAEFRRALSALDPDSAQRLHEADSQRLIRAYEVVVATGKTIAAWQRESTALWPPDLAVKIVVLAPPRELLYRAIDGRFAAMIEAGAVEEVARLLALQLDPALPIMKALGVTQLRAYLRREIDLPSAISHAQQASRNYAKRQTTWFRHRLPGALVLNAQYSETNHAEFCQKILQMA